MKDNGAGCDGRLCGTRYSIKIVDSRAVQLLYLLHSESQRGEWHGPRVALRIRSRWMGGETAKSCCRRVEILLQAKPPPRGGRRRVFCSKCLRRKGRGLRILTLGPHTASQRSVHLHNLYSSSHSSAHKPFFLSSHAILSER